MIQERVKNGQCTGFLFEEHLQVFLSLISVIVSRPLITLPITFKEPESLFSSVSFLPIQEFLCGSSSAEITCSTSFEPKWAISSANTSPLSQCSHLLPSRMFKTGQHCGVESIFLCSPPLPLNKCKLGPCSDWLNVRTYNDLSVWVREVYYIPTIHHMVFISGPQTMFGSPLWEWGSKFTLELIKLCTGQ